jgi:hypothetical protein
VLLAAIGVLVLGATSLAGCPAAHDDYPTLACKIDSDCFKGETCVALVCTPVQDLAVQPDLLFFGIDFAKPDLVSTDAGGDDL